MESFGQRIQFLMDTVGYAQLVEKTGISQSQFYRMRSGERDTTRKNIVSISDAAGCSLEWLAAGRGTPFPNSQSQRENLEFSAVAEPSGEYSVQPEPLSSDEIELLQLFRAAGLATKSRVLNELIK